MNQPPTPRTLPDAAILRALHNGSLLDDTDRAHFAPLTGGVSSDIWKVDTGEQVYCVKRALAQLKVEMDWRAPVERNRFEVAWYEIADAIVPGSAPQVLAHHDGDGLLVMEYLDPARHRLWKRELRAGRAEPAAAAEVGRRLARIHAATAGDATTAARFPRTDIFHAIRLEPYLEATAERHPDLRSVLYGLSRNTAATQSVMIHGDVSPKNIMLGPKGPVFLDAECACMGDPAFDLAFCLNHFLLKCLWVPETRPGFFACFEEMAGAYMDLVAWETPEALSARAAHLLPGLFLGRVDGKSPVEYLRDNTDKDRVRRCARALLADPPIELGAVLDAWRSELAR